MKILKESKIIANIYDKEDNIIETRHFTSRKQLDNYVDTLNNLVDMTMDKELYKNIKGNMDIQDIWKIIIDTNITEEKKKKPFIKRDAGNVEQNIATFNSMMTTSNGQGLAEALELPDNIEDFIKTNCNHCIFYKNPKGEEPVIDFILSQTPKMSAKICYDMTKLNNLGANTRRPLSAHLKDGIYELRTQLNNDLPRCLYFFIEGSNMVFTNGFIKKTQEVPAKEIELAMKRRNEFIKNERGD